MVPIYESDVAEERWSKSEWNHYELWEKVEQRVRRHPGAVEGGSRRPRPEGLRRERFLGPRAHPVIHPGQLSRRPALAVNNRPGEDNQFGLPNGSSE